MRKLTPVEQTRLIADYERRTGKPWQETLHTHEGMSPERPAKPPTQIPPPEQK
jgi:hypothetical protein